MGGRCSRPVERDPPSVASGVHEEHITGLGRRFCGGNASERIRRRSVAAAAPGHDVKAPPPDWHGRNRPGSHDRGLDCGPAIRVAEGQPDFVRRVRREKEDAAREHVGAVVIDANERHRGSPLGAPDCPIRHSGCGVMIGIPCDIPLDADRRDC